jgi:hypothetical protein
MRRRIALATVLAALALAGSALGAGSPGGATGATGATGPATPPAKQVRAALSRAARSIGLWATINICNTRKYPDTIGIRAQMPALGFVTTMQMVVTLGYYTTATDSFKPLRSSSTTLRLGEARSGYHQDGVTFTVKPPAKLDATVKFVWSSGSTVLGTITRTTVKGRTGVQQGDPPGYSSDICAIG